MTTTQTAAPTHADFTAEQKAEWRELNEQASAEHDAMVDAKTLAAGHLIYAIENPDASEIAMRCADAAARDAIEHRDEWRRLIELGRATPYGAFLQEHIARQREARTR